MSEALEDVRYVNSQLETIRLQLGALARIESVLSDILVVLRDIRSEPPPGLREVPRAASS